MRVNYYWLKELVDITLSPKELVEVLTMAGVEAGLLESKGIDLPGVVVGLINTVSLHPHSEHLFICQVDTGRENLQIVCGAPNTTPGAKVPVALVGSVLPGNRAIGRTEIKGIDSCGMICSEKELGLGTDDSKIWILPEEATIGQELSNFLNIDTPVVELNLTPNRADCLGMIGAAREVAALTGQKLNRPTIRVKEEGDKIGKYTSVRILEPELCPRYGARLIFDLNLKPSPFWMQRRLEQAGLRPINNIVDITNYVMLELGQPLHAFDYDLLEERRIVVRRANQGEALVTLDGGNRILNPENLVIADAGRGVALAGIMGGNNTEVNPATRRILLESAYFNPLSVRKTAKYLGLATEASRRFERGCNVEGAITALDRAAQLIEETDGGTVAKGYIDQYPKRLDPAKINIRGKRTNSILGTQMAIDEMKGYLERLELKVSRGQTEDDLDVVVPLFRPDLTREIDLIEEIARLYGYGLIPSTLPHTQIPEVDSTRNFLNEKKIKDLMIACGLNEIITLSFISRNCFEQLRLPPDDEKRRVVELKNPLSSEWAVMRTTMVPGLLNTVQLNKSHGNTEIKIFEIGKVYHPLRDQLLPSEKLHLGVALYGLRSKGLWYSRKDNCDFYDLKGVVETLLARLNISPVNWRPESIPYYWKGYSYSIYSNGVNLGNMGETHPDVLHNFDINNPVFLLEMDLELAFQIALPEKRYEPLPRYPAVYRDIAVIVPRKIEARSVEQIIRREGYGILKEVSLFDVYEGKPMEKGKKNLAFSLIYQSDSRTLTDQDVDVIQEGIIKALAREFGAALRS